MVGGVAYSAPISKVMIPLDEQKVSGSRDTATTAGVAGGHPKSQCVVSGDRSLGPQPGVEGEGVSRIERGIEQRGSQRRLVGSPGADHRRGVGHDQPRMAGRGGVST